MIINHQYPELVLRRVRVEVRNALHTLVGMQVPHTNATRGVAACKVQRCFVHHDIGHHRLVPVQFGIESQAVILPDTDGAICTARDDDAAGRAVIKRPNPRRHRLRLREDLPRGAVRDHDPSVFA